MDALWWKFDIPGQGTHQVRVKDIGSPGQQVSIDGSPVAGPPDQLIFTGPAASLLEFQQRANGCWVLFVDGVVVESYNPHDAHATLWKFTVPGIGTHQLRIKNIGEANQEVSIDGSPVEAPPGTTTFTGPGACLLQIFYGAAGWTLTVDGVYCPQNVSSSIPSSAKSFEYVLPNSGTHSVSVANAGMPGQQVFIDGVPAAAPEGTMTFTGPEGVLLQLQQNGESCSLFVDGVMVEETGVAGIAPREALWNFAMLDPSKTFQNMHQMRVSNIGMAGQAVFLDGNFVPAPDGTTMFTGPVGCLLEIKMQVGSWVLQIDGVDLATHNATVMRSGAPSSAPGVREAVAPVVMTSLPQGVSLDACTGRYTANIKVHGRFMGLGEFAPPEEASQRYQDEKKKHAS